MPRVLVRPSGILSRCGSRSQTLGSTQAPPAPEQARESRRSRFGVTVLAANPRAARVCPLCFSVAGRKGCVWRLRSGLGHRFAGSRGCCSWRRSQTRVGLLATVAAAAARACRGFTALTRAPRVKAQGRHCLCRPRSLVPRSAGTAAWETGRRPRTNGATWTPPAWSWSSRVSAAERGGWDGRDGPGKREPWTLLLLATVSGETVPPELPGQEPSRVPGGSTVFVILLHLCSCHKRIESYLVLTRV